ncbi:CRISPR-associated endonuclease Cas2 [Thermococcus radiotolerans]|uniref:CRISPR-associated endoribonuclease Cas2 n=1 Tax=Thermococcus radiotolerans TaxID=187880 RepID=A0A2Z2N817_9EURY|nr:CRISPR-associated endonuclease Cas2 [Thermococcus radiotolerans]ASJ13866.1 CRISPR-associated endonuclease Cas2 [Thermococcus radiotolerans]
MHVIVVYDVDKKRVVKVHDFLARYLCWRQNSVFEGEIDYRQLEEVKKGLSKLIDSDDSVLIYELSGKFKVHVIGHERNPQENII